MKDKLTKEQLNELSKESLVSLVSSMQAQVAQLNARMDSLMEQISVFVEESCEAEILGETREIR